jgi:hypothetical protein
VELIAGLSRAVTTTLGLALLAEDRAQATVDLVLGRLEIDGDDP